MGLDAMILVFWILSFKPTFYSPLSLSSRGSLDFLHFLPWGWCHLCIWGYWYFSWQSLFQPVLHLAWHFTWCTLHELLIAKFRLKLKKAGKTTRPFRYDLNQIPYNYTVEVTNRFKGLELIRVPEELWTEVHDIVQEAVIKTIHKKRNAKRQNGCLRKPY